jgi:hypothetical protein
MENFHRRKEQVEMKRALIAVLFLTCCSPRGTPAIPFATIDPSVVAPRHASPPEDHEVQAPAIDTKSLDDAIISAERARETLERRAYILDNRSAKDLR